jgi:hypothetical protein
MESRFPRIDRKIWKRAITITAAILVPGGFIIGGTYLLLRLMKKKPQD